MTDRGTYRRLFDLSGKVAVVTGGTGLLGRHFCGALADHGAKVAIVDLVENSVEAFACELTADYGPKCIGVACDITDPTGVKAMAERIETELGPIDILHNNAQAVRRNP